MKTKLINILLALVLLCSMSLATAVSVGAVADNVLNVANWSDPADLVNVSGRPAVIKVDETYHMWYGVNDTTLYHTASASPDSFTAGILTTFDTAPVEYASVTVCYENGTYYMIAYGSTDDEFAIYTSLDGNSWENKGLVFTGTNLPNYSKLDAPFLFKDGSTYRLYFQVKSDQGTSYSIYTAEASDGLNSIADGNNDDDFSLANGNSPVLSPGETDDWDGKYVMHPMVVKEGNMYYMWYSAHNSVQPQQIGFAWSANGYDWVKSPGNPIIGPVGEPSVINDEGVWRMWYLASGNKISYLTSTGPFEFSSIQSAVDAASSGDTIQVTAGIYNEVVTISKPLALLGAQAGLDARIRTGPESVIDPNDPNGGAAKSWVIKVKSSDVLIDGFTVQNPTLIYGSAGLFCVEASSDNHYQNLTFRNNILQNPGIKTSNSTNWGKFGYDIGYCDNVLIEYNYIRDILCNSATPWNGTAAIWPWNTNGLIIRYNKIEHATTFGIGLSNENINALVLENEIELGDPGEGAIPSVSTAGIRVGPSGNDDVEISGNSINNCPGTLEFPSAGIRIQSSGAIITEENVISNCPTGIRVTADSTDISNIIINNNFISDNTQFAISVADEASGGPLNATNNWWGHASGPKHETTNPNGLGNAVSDNVTYSPWLLVPLDEIDEEIEDEKSAGGVGEFEGAGVTVDTTGADDGMVTVTTALYSVPKDATKPLSEDAEGERALKYVDVKLTDTTYTGNVRITISYDEADLARMGVEEDTLKLYYFKMSNGPWTLAANQVLDMDNNTISGDIPASELSGTPLCIGGEATVTGQYEIGAPPSVTVAFTPTEMDPTVEQTVTVGVSVPEGEGRTLEELSSVVFKVWYDADSGIPTDSEFNDTAADTQTCAVITWNGSTFSLNANADDTTWSLGECTAPVLTGTSGDFILKFTPGKVATQTTFSDVWQLAAAAADEYGVGFGFDAEGAEMNWYGEMTLGSVVNVDWGSVPAGMDFDNARAKQALGTTITYISNGDYAKLVKSSATWAGVTNNATLNADGTPGSNEFSLKAYNADELGNAQLLDIAGATFDNGTITSDSGNTESSNYLWLKLGSTFSQDTYSGTITYLIGQTPSGD